MGAQILRRRPEIQPVRVGGNPNVATPRRIRAGKISVSIEIVVPELPRGARSDRGGTPAFTSPRDRVARLLPERGDAAVGLGLHQPERARVVHVVQRDRHGGRTVAVARDHRTQIEIGEDVAVQGEERLVESIEHRHDRAAGSQRLPLGDHVIAGVPLDEMNGWNVSSRYGRT